MQTAFHDTRFNSIQTLRGLAAILVIFEHIRFLSRGAYGVDIFFCISGFMIMLTTHKSTEHFFLKRLLRILPLYYIMTIGTYLLLVLFPTMFETTNASLPQLIKSLLFIPFDIGNGIIQPVMRIGWTINCEMFFYLLFWISYHINHKYRGLICSLFLFLMLGIGALISHGSTLSGETILLSQTVSTADSSMISPYLAPILFYGSPVMLEFALGILCYYLAQFLYKSTARFVTSKLTSAVFLVLGLSLLIILYVTTDHVNVLGYRRLLIWGIPAMMTVLCFFMAGLNLSMPTTSIRLGDISFSLYLIHYYPIMFLDRKIFDFSSITAGAVFGALAGILLVILLSIFSWHLLEKKLTNLLRRKLMP